MFEKILLPLDGSELAECVLPYGQEFASRLGSELVLFHVCSPEHKNYNRMHSLYLETVAKTVIKNIKKSRPKGEVNVHAESLIGEPVDTIANYIRQNGINLMMMTSAGASGIKLWVLGSVADKAFRAVNIPTMLVRCVESSAGAKKKSINRLLVTLDGSKASNKALPVAGELAKQFKASITLFQMVERIGMKEGFEGVEVGGGDVYAKFGTLEEKKVKGHLLNAAKGLRNKNIPVTYKYSRGFDAAEQIIAMEKSTGADIVIMATRGASPVSRWMFGSTAEKVLRQGTVPLLLVRE